MTNRMKHRSAAFVHTRILSIVSITVALFILGGIALVNIAGREIENQVKEQFTFTILLPVGQTDSDGISLSQEIASRPYVKAVKFISATQAAIELSKELGENPVDVLGFNPLQPMLEVHLHSDYICQDSLNVIKKDMGDLDADASINYRSDLLMQVQKNMSVWQLILWILAATMLVVCYLQINNTTRLVIYSKRMQIRTLSLVGATPGFIQRPIIWGGIVNGIIGAVLAVSLLAIGVYMAEQYLIPEIMKFFPYHYLLMGAVALVLVGIVISWLTSWRATRKCIRMDSGLIHLI